MSYKCSRNQRRQTAVDASVPGHYSRRTCPTVMHCGGRSLEHLGQSQREAHHGMNEENVASFSVAEGGTEQAKHLRTITGGP